MKITVEYNLPEEKEDFDVAQKGAELAYIIEELDQYLRRKIKYEELTEDQHKIYQEIRDQLTELKNGN